MNTLFFLNTRFFREQRPEGRKHLSESVGVLRIFFETDIDRTFRTTSEEDLTEDSLYCLDVRADHAKFLEISDRLWKDLKPTQKEIRSLRHFDNSYTTGIFLDRDKLVAKARQSQILTNLLVIGSGNQEIRSEIESSDPALLTLQVNAVKFPVHQFQIQRKALLELLYFFRLEYSIDEKLGL